MLSKVPEIATVFWIVKLIVASVGVSGAGELVVRARRGTAATRGVMDSWLGAALLLRMRARRYVPPIAWLTLVLVSAAATQATGTPSDGLGGSLYAGTAAFALTLAGRHLRDRLR